MEQDARERAAAKADGDDLQLHAVRDPDLAPANERGALAVVRVEGAPHQLRQRGGRRSRDLREPRVDALLISATLG